MRKLAIEGGGPARAKPLPPPYPGATVMGAEEAEQAAAVILAQSPFRYYGPSPLNAVRKLEDSMSSTLGVPYVLGVNSCTSALILALKALGIGYGDKVVVPANTFLATPGAVVCSNAVPVFADIDDSLNIDPDGLEAVIDEDVKAIIVVSIQGNPVDLDPVLAIAGKYGIRVIEDVAQSCGARYRGEYVGTMADIGVYSFQMNKILTAGEGGALVTRDARLFERAVRFHDQGLFRDKDRYGITTDDAANALFGQNYRMSELTGAVVGEQWKKLDIITTAMRGHSATIRQAVSKSLPELQFRKEADPAGSLGSALGMILPSADFAERFVQTLRLENIGVHFLYGRRPVYMLPQILLQQTVERNNFPFDYSFGKPVVYSEEMCPRAIDLMARTVYLPISPILAEDELPAIAQSIVDVYHFAQLELKRSG